MKKYLKKSATLLATLLAISFTQTAVSDPLDEVYWRNFYVIPIGRWNGETIDEFRNSMLSKTGGQEPENVKIAYSEVANFFMEHTQGPYYDYIYEPYYPFVFPDDRGWEIIRMMEWAKAKDARVNVGVNGMPWGDNFDQSVVNLHNYLEIADDGVTGPGGYNQRDRFGRFRSAVRGNDPTIDEVRDFASQLEMQLTLSPYCETVSDYWERNLRQSVRISQWYREQHPDLMINVSGSSEITQNVHANLDYPDYTIYSINEFRDWLRGEGLYAGQGQFASLQALNSAYGLSFATWEEVTPPTTIDWNQNTWWRKWQEFRIHQVDAIVQRQVDLTREMGWDADRIFAHQISGPLEEEASFEWRQQAAPLSTAYVTGGGGGITAYLDDTVDELQNDTMYQNDKNWGYFEYNPIMMRGNDLVPGTRAFADEALTRLWEDKASYVAPYLWDGGLTGALAPYTVRTRPIEFALQDFFAQRQFESPETRTKRESSFDSRSPIWSMSKSEHIENFFATTTPTFNNGKAQFTTLSSNAYVTLQFNEAGDRRIQSDEYHAVEFRMTLSNSSPSDEARFEWVDESGMIYSTSFTPKMGEHVYRINLGNQLDWNEKKITSLRLFPSDRSGNNVTLDWLLLRSNPSWHFDDPEEVFFPSGITSFSVADGKVSGTDNSNDGFFILSTDNSRANSLGPDQDADRVLIDANQFDQLRMKITSSGSGFAQIFFWHRGEPVADFGLVSGIPIQSGEQTVTVDLSNIPDWQGEITRLRIDPVNTSGVDFDIDYVSITPKLLKPLALTSDLIVNSANPVFLWDQPTETVFTDIRWEFQLARDFEFTDIATSRRALTTPEYVHPDASGELDGHYYWRVRAWSPDGSSSDWMTPMPIFIRRWNFDTIEDFIGPEAGGFTRPNDISNARIENGIYKATASDTDGNSIIDPFLYFNNGNNLSRGINTEIYDRFQVRYRLLNGPIFTNTQFFFYDEVRNTFGNYTESFVFTNGNWKTLDIDLSSNSNWRDYQKLMRFDPAESGPTDFEIDWAQFSSSRPTTPEDEPIEQTDDLWLIY